MSRRRAPSGPTISLFPFLAVLLCTMGALLVLLVLFSRSAKQADAVAEAEAVRQQAEELELARDEVAWRIDQLQGVRSRTADDLAKARMQLAGIEGHARSLMDELEQLERTAAALARPAEADDAEPIADLEQRLAAARAAAEAAREGAADRPPAYAVVPYEGSGGTHRRPLYIECCIDGVFLQPEGIRLGPGDFEGPPGPGNPLASALRAAREYLADRPGESGQPDAQPYPLLLVRPSGVMAYYAARESLQSWGSDFGYQFVDEDWTLTYPPADPALADAEQRAVDEARRRLEWLAQARPQKRTRPAVQYRASSVRGGVVSSEGPSVLGDQSRFDWTEQQAAAAGRGFRAGGDAGSGKGDAVLGNGTGEGEAGGGLATGAGGGTGAGPGDRYRGPSKFYGGSGQGDVAGEAGGDGQGGSFGQGGAGEGAGSGELHAGQEPSGGEGPGGVAGDGSMAAAGAAAGPGGGGGAAAAGAAGAAASDVAGGSGAGGNAGDAGGAAGGGSSGAGSGGGGGGSFGPALPGMAEGAGGASVGSQASAGGTCSPLAGRRGSNWASLATSDRPIPLTRPLRLECSADEFRLLGSGGRVTARVPIPARTADAVDPLVREVHSAVGGWGMAGDRMYWKPELVLTATPDGVARRDELEQLLADSGLDTRRSDDGDTVRNLPPVHRTGGVFRSR
jgi:hypothetical protein